MEVLKKLSKGQQISAGGAVAALVAIMLPWYKVKGVGGEFGELFGDDIFGDLPSIAGTDFTSGWLGLILLAGGAALAILPAFDKKVGTDKMSGEQIGLILAGVGGLFWLLRLVQAPEFTGRSAGLFIAAAAAAAVIFGIVTTMKENGIAMPTIDLVKDAIESATSSDESTATAASAVSPQAAPSTEPPAAGPPPAGPPSEF